MPATGTSGGAALGRVEDQPPQQGGSRATALARSRGVMTGDSMTRPSRGRDGSLLGWLLVEDALDDGGLLDGAGADVGGGGVEGGVTESGLDLGGVCASLAQAGSVGVSSARTHCVRSRSCGDSAAVSSGWMFAGDVVPRVAILGAGCEWDHLRVR